MKNLIVCAFLACCLCSSAIAGPFTDEMSRCIVKKTSESDKTLFIQWLFAAMSSHPGVKSMPNINISFEVVKSHGCAVGHEVGEKFLFSSAGYLLTNQCPEKLYAEHFSSADSFHSSLRNSFGLHHIPKR